ncbi:MAG TPA: alpha/beta hydrolase [Kofleriaceae bacterium]|nr:alpha/beta hydrolase [Kofleriaceae bacterium]
MARVPVLLIHSGGFTSRQWRKLAEKLAPTYDVSAPDLIGYGASGAWPDGAPFHFSGDVAHVAAKAATFGAPAHVVAHSYGGLIALHLARAHPERVRSLALFEPVAVGVLGEADEDARDDLARLDLTWKGGAWLEGFVDWWNGDGAWRALPEETRASMRTVGWKVFQEVASLVTDTATFESIHVPVLLLGGEQTPLAEKRMLARLAESIPGAEKRVFPGMGHMGPITHAAIVNDAIASWLDAQPR